MNEEQIARLQQVRDDEKRRYYTLDADSERRICDRKIEMYEMIAYIFGVELEPFRL